MRKTLRDWFHNVSEHKIKKGRRRIVHRLKVAMQANYTSSSRKEAAQ